MVDRFEQCRFCGGRGCAACPEEHRKWEANGGSFPPTKLKAPPPPEPVGACYLCGEPARFLCDGLAPGEDYAIARAEKRAARTCDRPMCDRHVACQSKVHVQRAGPNGRGRRCSWETIDLCVECHDRIAELNHDPAIAGAGIMAFKQDDLALAIQFARKGGQALHLHRIIADRSKAPRVFVQAVDRGEWIAHFFDQDRARLEATARRLGVNVIVVEREKTARQHIDLVGGPLSKALAEARNGKEFA